MAASVHIGDLGTVFQVTFTDENGNIINVSTATTKQILAKLPDGTNKIFGAIFTTNGIDGVIQYTTASTGDISQSGDWKFQGYTILANSDQWHTDTTVVTVQPNVDTP